MSQKTLLVASRELGLPPNLIRQWCQKDLAPSIVVSEGRTGRKTRAFTPEQIVTIRQSQVYLKELVRRKEEALAKVQRYDSLIDKVCQQSDENRLQELAFKHADHPVLNGGLTGER